MAAIRYYLIDDYSPTNGGGGTGNPIGPEFMAMTPADAATIAGQFAQIFNRPVRLVQFGGQPPWTPLYSPNTACRVFPSAVPPSVTF